MDGVLNIDKPAGMTSHDVVARVRKALRIKKVGHAGTLDPMATGVLLILLGHATRIANLLMEGEKAYRATCTFGFSTTTQDSTGEVVSVGDASAILQDDILQALRRFRGEIFQVPPMVSALHHEGQRLYELARKGREVERKPRPVTIYSLELLEFRPGERAEADMEIVCSRGTYIRTLCADIGESLGIGGHMSALERTRVGHFSIENAVKLEAVLAGEVEPISIDAALPDLPAITLDEADGKAVLHGNSIPFENHIPPDMVKLLDPTGRVLALARPVHRDGKDVLQPVTVFDPSRS